MAYASVNDIQARLKRSPLSVAELRVCEALLEDASVIVDAAAPNADENVKKIVVCRMVIRSMGSDEIAVPIGATQGSMSALGYSQSWTMSNSGTVGELYLSKQDKKLLGCGNIIGSYSPIQELAPEVES